METIISYLLPTDERCMKADFINTVFIYVLQYSFLLLVILSTEKCDDGLYFNTVLTLVSISIM